MPSCHPSRCEHASVSMGAGHLWLHQPPRTPSPQAAYEPAPGPPLFKVMVAACQRPVEGAQAGGCTQEGEAAAERQGALHGIGETHHEPGLSWPYSS